MNKNKKLLSFIILNSLIVGFLFFSFSASAAPFGTSLMGNNPGQFNSIVADPTAIRTSDSGTQSAVAQNTAATNQGFWSELQSKVARWAQETSWSKIFQSTLSSALNRIAFDTATWLGSGGKGQKPMFVTEGWGSYLANIGDNAAGTFIEELGRQGFNGKSFNLCNPDLAVQMRIGLGLINTYRPQTPNCTFSKLKQNWERELSEPDFLNRFQAMFSPTENDLGIALTLQTGIMEQQRVETINKQTELIAKKGWLDVESVISKQKISPPDTAEKELSQALALNVQNFAKYSGNALIDAANIFLNQLASSFSLMQDCSSAQ